MAHIPNRNGEKEFPADKALHLKKSVLRYSLLCHFNLLNDIKRTGKELFALNVDLSPLPDTF